MDAGPTAMDDGQTLQHTPPPYVVSDTDTEPDDAVGIIEVHTEPELLAVRDIELIMTDDMRGIDVIIEDRDEHDSEPAGQVTAGTSHTPDDNTTVPTSSTLCPQECDTPPLQSLPRASYCSPGLQLATPMTSVFTPVSPTNATVPQLSVPGLVAPVVSCIVTLHSQAPCLPTTSPSSPRSLLITPCLPKSHPHIPRFVTSPLSPRLFPSPLNIRPPSQRPPATRPHLLNMPPPPIHSPSPRICTFHTGFPSRAYLTSPYPNAMYPTPSLGANYTASPCPAPVNTHPLWMSATSPSHGLRTRPGTSSAGEVSRPQSAAGVADPRMTLRPGSSRSVVPSGGVLQTSNECNDTSSTDFCSPKRFKPSPPEEDDDDTDNCPICFEAWTNSGVHRLVALKCGHLFGQSCIEKWLKNQKAKCPQCNTKSTRRDIRPIYAKMLRVVDTTERDRALEELGRERAARRKVEMEMAQMRLQYQIVLDECAVVKEVLERQQQQPVPAWAVGAASHQGRASPINYTARTTSLVSSYVIMKNVKISECGGSRVMTYHDPLATLCLSQPSSNQLFPGYGVKKLNSLDFKTSEFVSLHSKAIRDLAINPDGLLLSCSVDKSIKLTSLLSNATVQSYTNPVPVWSCVWDLDDTSYFYAGLQSGVVRVFDVRNTSTHLQELMPMGTRSPVVALQYVRRDLQSTFRPGGVLVGQLDRVSFFEKSTNLNDYQPHLLPLHGNLTSLSVDAKSRHVLATFRPSAKMPYVRHQMCELTSGEGRESGSATTSGATGIGGCSCNIVHTFHGGALQKLLARTKLVPYPSDQRQLLVCAGDEASSAINIWCVQNGQLIQKLASGSPVVDICPVDVNNEHFLVGLMETQVVIYRWQ